MYTKEQKLKSINLFYQYNRAWVAVIRDLGYPSLGALKSWIKNYETDPLLIEKPEKKPKFTTKQQKVAIDYYFDHGQFITKTIHALGYPSKQTLRKWLRTDPRYEFSVHVKKAMPLENVKKIPTEIKTQAVAAIYQRNKTVQQLANQYQVSRKTLYDWKNNLLGTDFEVQSAKPESKAKTSDSDIVALRAKVDELEIQNDILRQINYLLKKNGALIN